MSSPVDDVLTLSELAKKLDTEGREILVDLYKGQPVLVVHPTSQVGEILAVTPPNGGQQVSDEIGGRTQVFTRPRVDARAPTEVEGLVSPLGVFAGGKSLVVPMVKTERNPFFGVLTLGRALNNDIRLAASTVSNQHVFFVVRDGQWFVQDKASTNGTQLNSVKLEPNVEHRVSPGDELRFGSVGSRFMDDSGLTSICGILV